MSTTIDQRVVEMRFDNKQFESNVSTTMSTLDKLKQKLNLPGASKGLEDVNTASKKVNMTGLGSAVEAVSMKFSALQVMGTTALANITNSAVNAGKRIVSALTIDPIKTGFSEYETQINAVQTILANTSSKGTTLQQVNSALDTLNKYADKTIYNFTEMTRNIGTFTAAGVDLDTSVSAIQGIANLAAVSGSTSQQASTAMYQLSQALSSGTVKLMDWNSVVNAGMGGQVFQDALKQTARVHGIAIDDMIEKQGSFRETLSEGWLTSEILTETLNQFTMAAEEGSAEWEAYKKSLMDTGYTEEQATSILKMANTATDAATKVKTFTQLWDTLKESAQSGWTESWEIMIGDFEEAKSFLTDVSDRLGSMIGESAEARNKVLTEGLSSGWKQLLGAGIADEEGYKEIFKSVAKEHGTSIDDMIAAEKKLDDSLTDTEAFQKALKTGFKDGSISADMLTESVHKMADKMSNMSAEELKAAGYTQDHVTQIKELSAGLKDGSISMDDFVNKMMRSSGRENIIQALWNAFDGLMSVIKPVKEAFRDIFPPVTGEQLYKLTEQIRDLTAKFKLSDEQAAKVKSVFKGLFSVIDIGLTAIKAFVKGAFSLLGAFTGLTGGLLDGAASIGDFLSNLRDSIKETNFFGKAVDAVVGFLTKAIDKIKEFGQSLTSGFKSSESSGIFGFFKGLWSIVKKVSSAIVNTLSNIISTITEIFGKGDIFEVLNSGLIAGILLGINKFTSSLSKTFKDVGGFMENITNILDSVRGCFEAYQQQLKAGALLKIAAAIAILAASLFLLSTIDPDSLGSAVLAISVLFAELVGSMALMNKFGGKSKLFDSTGSKMIAMSVSILILAAALKSLSGLSWEQMAVGLVAISALLWELVAVSIVMSKTGSKMIEGSVGLIALATAIKILASACKDFADMSWEEIWKGLAAIGGLLLGISVFENVAGRANHVVKTGVSMILIAASMKIFASVLSDLATMRWNVIAKGLTAMGIALAELAIAMKLMPSGSMFKATGLVIAAASLKILADVLSDFGKMKWGVIGKGLAAMGGALAELAIGLKLMKGTLWGAAALVVASGALAVIAPIMKTLSKLSWEEIAKGLVVLAGAFAIIGVAGLLLKPLILPILGLAAAFVLLGVGMVGIGAGLMLVAAGISALAVALSAGATSIVAALVVVVSGILELIPTIARIIGEGIVELAKVIGEYAPQLAESCLQLVTSVLQSLAEHAPQITDALADFLIGVINSLADHMPALIDALVNLLAKTFQGLGKALKKLNFGSLRDGIDAALGLSALLMAMSLALKIAGGVKLGKALKGVIALTAMAIPLAALVGILSLMDGVEVATTSIIALVALAAACTLLLIPLNLIGSMGLGSALKGVLSLTLMAVPLLAFVGVLALMSGVDNAMTNVQALVLLAGALTLMLIPLTLIGTFIGAALAGVLALTAMAIPMLAFVGVLALLDCVDNAMANALLLGTFMSTMADVLVKVSLVAPLALVADIAIAGLVLVIAAIGALAVAIGALMEEFPSIQEFLDSGLPILEQLAGSIGTMIGEFIGGIGEGLGDSLVKIGEDIAAFMDTIATASASASKIKSGSFDGVEELLLVLLEIGGTSVGTSITDLFSNIFSGEDSMEKFETDGVAFFNAMKKIGEASSEVSINEEAMSSIIGVAQEMSNLQQSLESIGGVIDWFAGKDDLGTFGANAASFIFSMKLAFNSLDGAEFNTEAMDQIVVAATSLSTLQQSLEPIGGVISWFSGRDDLGTFGTSVASFVFSMKLAFNSLDGAEFNTEAMDQIVVAATSLSTLQQSLEPIGGVVSWFSGRDDLGTFGTSVASFVTSMKTAFASLEGAEFNAEAMDQIVAAATSLSTLQQSLEPIGGVVSWFSGRDDLGTFGENIGLFAEGMAALKTGMGEDGIPESVVTSVMNAGKAIVELQEALPEDGWFDSKMDLDDFSEYVEDFAEAMATFGEKAATLNPDSVNVAINTAQRIRLLINSLANLDTSGVETFTGVGTGGVGADGVAYDIAEAMAEFSSKVAEINTDAVSTAVNAALRLKSLIASLVGLDTSGIENFKPVDIGNQMKNYADKVAGIDTEAVAVSVSAANKLKNLIAGLVGLDPSGVANFRAAAIGTALKTYSNSISEVNVSSIVASIGGAKVVKSFISSLAGLDTSGVSSFKTAINQLSTVSIEELVEAFSGASSKLSSAGADMIEGLTKGMRSKLSTVKVVTVLVATTSVDAITSKIAAFSKAGGDMATKLASGFSSKKSSITSAISSCLSSATTTLRNKYTAFYNAGAYLVKGFAKGIDENTWRAEAKARAMAEAAVEAAKDELEINSPSKVFKKIGSGIPEGFAMGIGMLGGSVKDSVASMASTAITATKSTMGTILDALSADMDAQPTIRPVIDLSNVRTGANAINGMFDGVRTVGVRANLNAINATMNARLQNGSNDDVVSAINELNAGLKNVRGDTYNFEGITYSDGDEVSDAVQTLVRHIRLGRRM